MTCKTIFITVTTLLIWLTLTTCRKKNIDFNFAMTKWEVKSVKMAGVTFSKKAKESYILEFVTDTTCMLTLDVNHCWGDYEIPSKGKIDFVQVACTEIGGGSEFAENIPMVLRNTTDYYVRGQILILTGFENGRIKLNRH